MKNVPRYLSFFFKVIFRHVNSKIMLFIHQKIFFTHNCWHNSWLCHSFAFIPSDKKKFLAKWFYSFPTYWCIEVENIRPKHIFESWKLKSFNRHVYMSCGILVMVFNATFNNSSVISWFSVLLVEETVVPGENNRPAASHWQTLQRYACTGGNHLGPPVTLRATIVHEYWMTAANQ